MRLKKKKVNKTEGGAFRCTEEQMNAIKGKALMYADGNLSEWIVYASMNYVPSGEELDDEPKKKKRRKK